MTGAGRVAPVWVGQSDFCRMGGTGRPSLAWVGIANTRSKARCRSPAHPAERNLESAAALAVDQAGGDMQDAVAQGGRPAGGEVVVQSQQPGPGEQDARAPGQITSQRQIRST